MRSLKYQEVFSKTCGSVRQARGGIGAWLIFYNDVRQHQAPGYRTPREISKRHKPGDMDNAYGFP